MWTHFEIDDADWMAAEARRLWANEPDIEHNRLHQMLVQNPQPHLRMPDWIDFGLDPFSDAYRAQILRLWQALFDRGNATSASEYNIAEHEQDAAYEACPIRFPGYFARRDPQAVRHAGYEIAMLADVMVHSGLSNGMHAIEYGAGSGNIAINLSRLGVTVDTVDISQTYCDHITQNAEFYGIPLQAHNKEFGFSPKGPDFKYDCILFHACFHHSIDHADLVAKLPAMLAEGGTLILSNEPILDDFYCPWGLRTDPECISVVSGRGWMELGFRTSYLASLFAKNGLLLSRIANNFSQIPLYIARKVPLRIDSNHPLFRAMIEGCYEPEEHGTWTTSEARITVINRSEASHLKITMSNMLPFPKTVSYTHGIKSGSVEVHPNNVATVVIELERDQKFEADKLILRTEPTRPADIFPGNQDQRPLGITLHSIEYGEF